MIYEERYTLTISAFNRHLVNIRREIIYKKNMEVSRTCSTLDVWELLEKINIFKFIDSPQNKRIDKDKVSSIDVNWEH